MYEASAWHDLQVSRNFLVKLLFDRDRDVESGFDALKGCLHELEPLTLRSDVTLGNLDIVDRSASVYRKLKVEVGGLLDALQRQLCPTAGHLRDCISLSRLYVGHKLEKNPSFGLRLIVALPGARPKEDCAHKLGRRGEVEAPEVLIGRVVVDRNLNSIARQALAEAGLDFERDP